MKESKNSNFEIRIVNFRTRLRRCWRLLLDPAGFERFDAWAKRIATIECLLASPEAKALAYSVEKVSADPTFHASKDHERKRREAIEWATHWARERRIRLRT